MKKKERIGDDMELNSVLQLIAMGVFVLIIGFIFKYTHDVDFKLKLIRLNPLIHKEIVDVKIVKMDEIEKTGEYTQSSTLVRPYERVGKDHIPGYMVHFYNDGFDIQLVLTENQVKDLAVNQTGYLQYRKTQFISFEARK